MDRYLTAAHRQKEESPTSKREHIYLVWTTKKKLINLNHCEWRRIIIQGPIRYFPTFLVHVLRINKYRAIKKGNTDNLNNLCT